MVNPPAMNVETAEEKTKPDYRAMAKDCVRRMRYVRDPAERVRWRDAVLSLLRKAVKEEGKLAKSTAEQAPEKKTKRYRGSTYWPAKKTTSTIYRGRVSPCDNDLDDELWGGFGGCGYAARSQKQRDGWIKDSTENENTDKEEVISLPEKTSNVVGAIVIEANGQLRYKANRGVPVSVEETNKKIREKYSEVVIPLGKQCGGCIGRGEVECQNCNGVGQVRSSNTGVVLVRCVICDGFGLTICEVCRGWGRFLSRAQTRKRDEQISVFHKSNRQTGGRSH